MNDREIAKEIINQYMMRGMDRQQAIQALDNALMRKVRGENKDRSQALIDIRKELTEDNKPNIVDIISGQFAKTGQAFTSEIKRGFDLADEGKQSKIEAALQAASEIISAPFTFTVMPVVGTIVDYTKQKASQIKPESLVHGPMPTILQTEDKVTLSDYLEKLGNAISKLPERVRRNIGAAVNIAGMYMPSLKPVKKALRIEPFIESKTGKILFKQVAGITSKTPNSDVYLKAIKLASNKDELAKITAAYVQSGGNLANLTEEITERLAKFYDMAQEDAEKIIRQAIDIRTPEAAGLDIRQAFTEAKKSIKEKYAKTEEKLFAKIGEKTGRAVKEAESNLRLRISKMLEDFGKEIGFDIGSTPRHGAGVGTMPITIQQQMALNRAKNVLEPVEDFNGLMRARRELKTVIDNWGLDQSTYYVGAKADKEWLTKTVYSKLNDIYHTEVEKMFGGANGKTIRKLLEENDKFYSEAMQAIEKLQSGTLGTGRIHMGSLRERLSRISTDDFKEAQRMAKKIPELQPIINEIRQGIFEEVLFKTIDASGKLNIKRFAQEWGALYKDKEELLDAVLTKRRVKQIEKAIDDYTEDTKRIVFFAPEKSERAKRDALENILSRRRIEEAQELRFIDNILGLSGDESFLTRAMRFNYAKELGMDVSGRIASVPLHATGKSMMGAIIGGTSGGSLGVFLGRLLGDTEHVGASIGGLLGYGAGSQLGLWLQSPAANIWLYKTLSHMPTFKAIALRAATTGTIHDISNRLSPTAKEDFDKLTSEFVGVKEIIRR